MSRRWRQLTIWVHVTSSVGWMAMALVLFALLLRGAGAGDPGAARAAAGLADFVDISLLAPMANASAFTGLVLSFATAWGLVQHRWVLAKFVITVVQLCCGIFLLHGALRDAATTGVAPPLLIVAIAVMASAVALQAWLSIAKPGKRTRWATDRRTDRPIKLSTAPTWVFVTGVVAPLADVAIATALGRPLPIVSVVVLPLVIGARVRARRSAPAGRRREDVAAAAVGAR